MKNELKERRTIKQYEEYYSYYNKLVRPVQEKQETHVVQGTVSWQETSVHNTIKLVVGGQQ